MSPLVQLTAVEGLLKPSDSDRYRPYIRGDQVDVSDTDAARLIAAGTAALVVPASVPTATEPPRVDIAAMTVERLRAYAKEHAINLKGAVNRPDILEAIEDALTTPIERSDADAR